MRGIISAAMLCALDDLGYKASFDVVYGFSSGAVNAAYFLAGETWYPLSIYFDDLASRRFVDFWRPFTGGTILDLDFAFDVVMQTIKPLDYQAVLTSATQLRIAITLVNRARSLLAGGFQSPADLRAALRASCWLPFATRGTAIFRGEAALDGGLLQPTAFRGAIEDGSTHVLSLSTRPMHSAPAAGPIGRRLIACWLNRLSTGLGSAYLRSCAAKIDDLAYLKSARIRHASIPYLLDLAPLGSSTEVQRHELKSGTLLRAARDAYAVMYGALEGLSSKEISEGAIDVIPRLTVRKAASARLNHG
jgi:predicted acylesterase/phospholipase RssA